jgi:hypothetical protein
MTSLRGNGLQLWSVYGLMPKALNALIPSSNSAASGGDYMLPAPLRGTAMDA